MCDVKSFNYFLPPLQSTLGTIIKLIWLTAVIREAWWRREPSRVPLEHIVMTRSLWWWWWWWLLVVLTGHHSPIITVCAWLMVMWTTRVITFLDPLHALTLRSGHALSLSPPPQQGITSKYDPDLADCFVSILPTFFSFPVCLHSLRSCLAIINVQWRAMAVCVCARDVRGRLFELMAKLKS